MKRLRLYLIIAILVVGLIPKPEFLFDQRCTTFYSAFLRVTLNYEDCAGGNKTNQTVITIPGFLDWRRKFIPALIVTFSDNHFYLGILTQSSKYNPPGWWDLIKLGPQ